MLGQSLGLGLDYFGLHSAIESWMHPKVSKYMLSQGMFFEFGNMSMAGFPIMFQGWKCSRMQKLRAFCRLVC